MSHSSIATNAIQLLAVGMVVKLVLAVFGGLVAVTLIRGIDTLYSRKQQPKLCIVDKTNLLPICIHTSKTFLRQYTIIVALFYFLLIITLVTMSHIIPVMYAFFSAS